MIHVVGHTTDGKQVASGVYRFNETHGIPLDVVLSALGDKGMVPCWMALYREMATAGMAHDRILSKLDAAISDSYGASFRDHVIPMLERLHELGKLQKNTEGAQ